MPVVPFAAPADAKQPGSGAAMATVPPKDQFIAMAAAMMQREQQQRQQKNQKPNAPTNRS